MFVHDDAAGVSMNVRKLDDERPQTFLAIGIETTITCVVARGVASALEEPVPIGEWEFEDTDRLATVRAAITEISRRLDGLGGVVDDGIDMISVASIGKLDALNGKILRVARPGWPMRGYPLDLSKEFSRAGGILAEFAGEAAGSKGRRLLVHNDATAAAYAEFRRGAGKGLVGNRDVSFVFIRVGEGVNAGLVVNLDAWRGGLHPEIGHIRPRRHAIDLRNGFDGVCFAHGNCIEGLISTAALIERWGTSDLTSLSRKQNDAARDIISFYVAQMCAVVSLTLAPLRIALGGATLDVDLCRRVRRHYAALIGSYPGIGDGEDSLDSYICEAKSGRTANVFGALELARAAVFRGPRRSEQRAME